MSALPVFQEVKRRPDGRQEVFCCRLLAREGQAVILHYRLTVPWTVGGLRLEPGDETIAYYWTDRPYNVYHWLRSDGWTAGVYFNAARDTVVSADRVEWTDLGLDLLVLPGGRAVWVDEEDLTALAPADQKAARRARERIEADYRTLLAWVEERSAALRAQVRASR
ncbi:MAG: DUF402 domain-containing protein [Armatimonadota bacterium]|nr:DUF402 domain-containing protein [Armatimonadota bacterium]